MMGKCCETEPQTKITKQTDIFNSVGIIRVIITPLILSRCMTQRTSPILPQFYFLKCDFSYGLVQK